MAREQLSQKVLAQRLDIDVRQIRNLEKKPGFPVTWKRDDKTYPWPEVLHWYVNFKLESASAKFTGPQRLQSAMIRDMEARAAKTELALAKDRGAVIDRHTVRRERRLAWGVIRNINSTRASRWLSEVEGLTGPLLLTKLEDLAEQEILQLQQMLLALPTYDDALRDAIETADAVERSRGAASADDDADRSAES